MLVPVLRDDLDLDWAIYEIRERCRPTPAGCGPPRGRGWGRRRGDVPTCVLVPALAVGADGTRLGRGGGSYDRALARVPAGRPWSPCCTTASSCPPYRPSRTTGGSRRVVTPSGARHPVDAGP